MESSKDGPLKEADMSYLGKEAEYVTYLNNQYFSGKDINGEAIYEIIRDTGGHNILKASRLPPIYSYADPVAYEKEVAKLKEKSLVFVVKNEESRRFLGSAMKQVGSSGVRERGNGSSDSMSLQEIPADVWKGFLSSQKQAKSGAGPSKKHR